MKLNRLIYKSIANKKFLEEGDITKLLNQSIRNNKAKGINGILLLSGHQFLQVLEGPPKLVNELYKNIVNDERHNNVQLLHYESISDPFFSDWNMRLIELDKISMPAYKMFLKKYPHSGKSITFPESKILLHSLLLDTLYFASLKEN